MADIKTDGITHLPGGGIILTADGVEYQIEPLDWKTDFPKLEEQYKRSRMSADDPTFLTRIENIKSAAMREEMLNRAYADLRKKKEIDVPTEKEVFTWVDTHDGVIFTFWLQMVKKNPSLRLEDVETILAKAGLAELKNAINLRDEANKRLSTIADAVRSAGIDPVELMATGSASS